MNNYRFSRIGPEFYDEIRDYRQEMLDQQSPFDGCASLENYEDIEKWHLNCQLFESAETVPPGYSIGFEYLYLENDRVVGMVNLRPEAMSHVFLKQYGGHIGYSVRPSARGRGIGTGMLRDFLPICRDEYHLKEVLITCLKDNEASRRIILNNGGIYDGDVYYPPADELLERYMIRL